MSETKVEASAADGKAEAYLYTPSNGNGPWPGVIFLTDIMGIRDANLGMAKRIAEIGIADAHDIGQEDHARPWSIAV